MRQEYQAHRCRRFFGTSPKRRVMQLPSSPFSFHSHRDRGGLACAGASAETEGSLSVPPEGASCLFWCLAAEKRFSLKNQGIAPPSPHPLRLHRRLKSAAPLQVASASSPERTLPTGAGGGGGVRRRRPTLQPYMGLFV